MHGVMQQLSTAKARNFITSVELWRCKVVRLPSFSQSGNAIAVEYCEQVLPRSISTFQNWAKLLPVQQVPPLLRLPTSS